MDEFYKYFFNIFSGQKKATARHVGSASVNSGRNTDIEKNPERNKSELFGNNQICQIVAKVQDEKKLMST